MYDYKEKNKDRAERKRHLNVNSGTSESGKTIQRHTAVPGTDFRKSAPGPDGKRHIMVKKNEAATIYIRNDCPFIPAEFRPLGISVMGSIIDPEDSRSIYNVFVQGAVPESDIQIRHLDNMVKKAGGRERTNEEQVHAAERLELQKSYLTEAIRAADTLDLMINALISGDTKIQAPVVYQDIDTILKGLTAHHMSADPEQRITAAALGMDILYAVYAMKEILEKIWPKLVQYVKPEVGPPYEILSQRQKNDCRLIMDVVRSELELRMSQVTMECLYIPFKPEFPTGCAMSANKRSILLSGGADICEAADFSISPGSPLNEEIGWKGHLATRINVDPITRDSLFIEDAVGKSLIDNEASNAHWYANLYGIQEDRVKTEPDANIKSLMQPKPQCIFNRLSYEFRSNYFRMTGIRPGESWKIDYLRSREGQKRKKLGTLYIHITSDFMFGYDFNNTSSGESFFAFDFSDFLRETADSVIDGLILQQQAVAAYRREQGSFGIGKRHSDLKTQMNRQYILNTKTEDFADCSEIYLFGLEDISLPEPVMEPEDIC